MYKCYISWRLAVCTRYFYKFIGEHDDQFFINKNVKSLLSVVPRLPILRYPQQQLGRLQPSIDICCPRPSSAANHAAARRCCCRSTGQTYRRTENGHPTVTKTLHRILCRQCRPAASRNSISCSDNWSSCSCEWSRQFCRNDFLDFARLWHFKGLVNSYKNACHSSSRLCIPKF